MHKDINIENKVSDIFTKSLIGKTSSHKSFFKAYNDFKRGNQKIIHIQGKLGVGKSFYVKDVCSQINDASVIKSKNEKFASNIPYSGTKLLFKSIKEQIEKLPHKEQELWRFNVNNKFSTYYNELTSIDSDFANYLNEPKNQDDSLYSSNTLKNKINKALIDYILFNIDFLNAKFGVLLFENCQWIDNDSITLIEYIIEANPENLLIVLTQRTSYENSSLALQNLVKSEGYNSIVESIHLKLLSFNEQNLIIDEIFHEQTDEINAFKDFCYNKSQGNFQKLKSIFIQLNRINYLNYNENLNKWKLNIEDVSILDTLEDFTIDQLIENLDLNDRLILQICSCFGMNINTAFISRICDIKLRDLNLSFSKFVDFGILKPAFLANDSITFDEVQQLGLNSSAFIKDSNENLIVTNFEFANDLYQDYIQKTYDVGEKRLIHKKITDYYLHENVLGVTDRDLYYALYHLNNSIHDKSTEKEKLRHFELNQRGAQKALRTASFDYAYDYFKECLKYNDYTDFKRDYEKITAFHILGYEICRISMDEKLYSQLYQNVKKNCTKYDINNLRLRKLIADIQEGKLKEGLATGVNALNSLGINVSKKTSLISVVIELIKAKLMLRKYSESDILNLPKLEDKNYILIQDLIFWLFRTAQYLNPNLNGVLSLKNLQITLKKGTYINSYSGFMAYGIIIGAGTDKYEDAYKYAKIGDELAKRDNNDHGSVYFGRAVYNAFKISLASTLDFYAFAKDLALKDGDFLSASEPTVNESLTYWSSGKKLDLVHNQIVENEKFCRKLKMPIFEDFQKMLNYHVKRATKKSITPQETRTFNEILDTTTYNFTPVCSDVINLGILIHGNKYVEAFNICKKPNKNIRILTGLHIYNEFHFYSAIALIKKAKTEKGLNKFLLKYKFNRILKRLKKWAKSTPVNFEYKYLLLQGLKAEYDSSSSFEGIMLKCIESCKQSEAIHIEAFANHILAEYFKNSNQSDKHLTHQQKSQALYDDWGFVKD